MLNSRLLGSRKIAIHTTAKRVVATIARIVLVYTRDWAGAVWALGASCSISSIVCIKASFEKSPIRLHSAAPLGAEQGVMAARTGAIKVSTVVEIPLLVRVEHSNRRGRSLSTVSHKCGSVAGLAWTGWDRRCLSRHENR